MQLFALELGEKNTEYDFVYTLASTNINQSSPNSVKNVCGYTISDEFIINLIGLERSELSLFTF